jgi:hypothetical protein
MHLDLLIKFDEILDFFTCASISVLTRAILVVMLDHGQLLFIGDIAWSYHGAFFPLQFCRASTD